MEVRGFRGLKSETPFDFAQGRLSASSGRAHHPTNEDLSVGAPALGHPVPGQVSSCWHPFTRRGNLSNQRGQSRAEDPSWKTNGPERDWYPWRTTRSYACSW